VKFDKLSEKAKERARQDYRETGMDYEWWDAVYEDAKEILQMLGFCHIDINFSGFWSQGDGACFTGDWGADDVKVGKVAEHAPKDEKLHAIAAVIEEAGIRWQTVVALDPDTELLVPGASLRHHGSYCHEHTVTIDTADFFEVDEEPFVEACRDLMRWIYKQLEAEYDYLTSDETIDDNIRANEWEFTKDGEFLPAKRRAA
jgi:hypothetical protein